MKFSGISSSKISVSIIGVLTLFALYLIPAYAAAPQVCLEEFPEDSSLSKIKKELYIKEIKAGITEWQNMLKEQSTFPRADNWKWDIDVVNYSDSIQCDVIVKFKDKPENENKKLTLGTFQNVEGIGIINMYYFTPYSCETSRDSQYIYYGICRNPIDLATTVEFGSIFRHEFGHALGLAHVDINTSLMHPIFELISYKGKITTGDVKNVIEMYPNGFYSQDPISESEIIEYTPDIVRPIPDWIRSNALWWSSGKINDETFVVGIKYLISQDILVIPATDTIHDSTGIPSWIKDNARWWANGEINDETFVLGIQYLIQQGIILVN